MEKSKEREVPCAPTVVGVACNGADVRSRKLAAVQGHQVEAGAEATHRYAAAFAVHTVDGYTGDALQRLGKVGVRELADVLGGNCVDDAGCVALDIHRCHQAAADTRNNYFFEFVGLFLGEYRVDEHCTTNDGEQCL